MNEHPALPKQQRNRRGVVAVVSRADKLLVICRSQHVVAPGAFCFPGGHIEAEESEEQALIREMREELGALIHPVRRLWNSVTPWGTQLAWWLGDLPLDTILEAHPAEVASFHWLTPSEMAALPKLLESNRHFLAALARQEIALDEH